MNNTAIKVQQISNAIEKMDAKSVESVALFVDNIAAKNNSISKKIVKIKGILKDVDIDFNDLKELRKKSWEHLEKEFE